MSDLMQKLAISKAIMDRHNNIDRGQSSSSPMNINQPSLDEFQTPRANYNLPQEFMSESKPISTEAPVNTKDKILNSRLPDEIKKLMLENPIQVSNPLSPSNSVLSDELVERASRLMGTKKPQQSLQSQGQNTSDSNLRQIMKEVVQEVLKENGLITESSSKTDEIMMIKVGKHLFEGKISRVKKLK
jgi:uncharacterized protein YneF (UPF0154 family)